MPGGVPGGPALLSAGAPKVANAAVSDLSNSMYVPLGRISRKSCQTPDVGFLGVLGPACIRRLLGVPWDDDLRSVLDWK